MARTSMFMYRMIIFVYIIFSLIAVSSTYSCNETDIFHCEVDYCIPRKWVCDGEVDCKSGIDEEVCYNQIKSGDQIALRAECNYFEYLSHYYSYASTHPCPGWIMFEYDWIRCKPEIWTIFAYNRSVGEHILWGDWVILQGDNSTYLNCQSYYAGVNECHLTNDCSSDFTNSNATAWTTDDQACRESLFRIIQRGRELACAVYKDYHDPCVGKPINVNREIYLLHSTKSNPYYLSVNSETEDKSWVGLKQCPGSELNQLDVDECGCEKWLVFRE